MLQSSKRCIKVDTVCARASSTFRNSHTREVSTLNSSAVEPVYQPPYRAQFRYGVYASSSRHNFPVLRTPLGDGVQTNLLGAVLLGSSNSLHRRRDTTSGQGTARIVPVWGTWLSLQSAWIP
ncbi:hypothetical protein MRX96_018245 [Rhipicephalus microplus]